MRGPSRADNTENFISWLYVDEFPALLISNQMAPPDISQQNRGSRSQVPQ
eukprot:m.59017 g.59017  ORF g.59017 m.59017 type:complete len:50 (-) comp49207_c0_seq13:575-724(-)